ncbi:MAG: glycosyltransferase family 2 protein [Winogradskyella sp.]|uniref:glycosyltransferase family 2 protein n=1 Tax=Winogradskyella sp. TaxID=1883156 RepID=UPI00385E651B
MAFFSVVISVYNKEAYIKNTLQSVLKQTYKDFEIIVVNDGSTDHSVTVIESLKDKRIKLLTIKNQGASNARNVGIKAATSDYIALLDGDDTWENSYLQFMYDAIREFPEMKVFTAGLAQKYDNKIIPVDYSFKQVTLYDKHNYFNASQKFSIIHSSSIVFHKAILEKTGFFDTSIISGQDTDLWIRFGLYYDILFVNKQLAHYNYYPSSLSNTTFELSKKAKFDKYLVEEKQNKDLKAFLDRNRYSMAILSKVQNDQPHFLYFTSHLDSENLNFRQNLLLKSPKWLLRLLVKLKSLKGEKLYYPNT